MLRIKIPSVELYNEKTSSFISTKECDLQLEHSLISLSKWESKWCKPFLNKETKTTEQTLDYIRCMTITQNVDPSVYSYMPQTTIDEITEYIYAPMTATTFSTKDNKINREVITSELIYYWMVVFQIDWEAQRWHLNRLITLITICSLKNQPQKKLSKSEILKRNRELNEARRAKYNTNG